MTDIDDTRTRHSSGRSSGRRRVAITGWGTAVRLGIAVSTVAALLVAAFAGRVADSTLICAVIAAASLVGWRSAEHAPLPAALRVRRR
ncbi:MAG: hypothetical protein JWM12_266 [Ilumatobacteraceae bacterium]|nr:hypothetical protein [Ilumatobacteraceae bacterium]